MTERLLTLCEFNVENLFISLAYHQGQDLEQVSESDWREFALIQMRAKQKPLSKLWALAATIEDIAPDVLMLVEVGGEESLLHFNRIFLKDRFVPYFIEGNSQRGIDLAFLVRKDLGLEAEARSNRETPVEVRSWQRTYVTRFSRDVAELRLSDESGLKLIILLAHLKSKLSTDEDFQGRNVRTAEANALAALYEKLRAELPGTPIVVGGDFNAELSSLELELLRRTDLTDFHDVLGTEDHERISHIHLDRAGIAHPMTLDHLLISPDLRSRVVAEKSRTYRYKGFYEVREPLPSNPGARFRLPSDHYPLVLTLRL